MCFIDQLDAVSVSTLHQATNVTGNSFSKSKRWPNAITESSTRNITCCVEWNAARNVGSRTNTSSPTATDSSAFFVSKRRLARWAASTVSNRASCTTKLHCIITQSAKPDARLSKKSEFRNLFWHFGWICWLSESYHSVTRICAFVNFSPDTAGASMELITSNKNSASDHYAVGEVDTSSKADSADCRCSICSINSADNSNVGAFSSTILPNVLATEASQFTHAPANATDYWRQFRKQHKVFDATFDAWLGEQQRWNEWKQLAHNSHYWASFLCYYNDGFKGTTAYAIIISQSSSTALC